MYIEIGDHKTIIFTENNNYESSENLDYWEHKLTNVCFSRPHKSFILIWNTWTNTKGMK